jgi:hypothetical protein
LEGIAGDHRQPGLAVAPKNGHVVRIRNACALYTISVRLGLAVARNGFDAVNVAPLNIARSAKGEIPVAGNHSIAIAADR